MLSVFVTLAAIYCAFRVMRAGRLLHVTIWLAVTSALVSILLFMLGAPEVAVIELSVGAGLVTVLFVFAFSITGEITFDELALIPRLPIWLLTGGAVALLAWFTLPVARMPITGEGTTFASVLWDQRGLDVLVQIVLIFAGVMGLMELLWDKDTSTPPHIRREAQFAAALPPADMIDLEEFDVQQAVPHEAGSQEVQA